jgi:very-short-patch-repair endonuclease
VDDRAMSRQLVRRSDLVATGATEPEIRRAVDGLQRIAAGTYADLRGLSGRERHLLRTRAVLGRVTNVVASHVSAAVLWDLPLPGERLGTVHVSRVPPRTARPTSTSRYRMHSPLVSDDETTTLHGLRATGAVRTVTDCVRLLDPDWGVAIADAALHRGLVTGEALSDAARGIGRLKGSRRVRLLPGRVSALAESPAESLLRLRLIRLGYRPREQVSLPSVPGSPRVDFLVDPSVVVEFDGRGKYSIGGDPERAHWEDKQRHDRLVDAGFEVVHVTWDQLADELALQVRIERALRRARVG